MLIHCVAYKIVHRSLYKGMRSSLELPMWLSCCVLSWRLQLCEGASSLPEPACGAGPLSSSSQKG